MAELTRSLLPSLRINGVLVSAAVLCSLAIIIVSAAKHSTGVDNCTALFSADNTDTTANTICNIWTWIQIGIMGLLFVLVALCQVRLLLGALDGRTSPTHKIAPRMTGLLCLLHEHLCLGATPRPVSFASSQTNARTESQTD